MSVWPPCMCAEELLEPWMIVNHHVCAEKTVSHHMCAEKTRVLDKSSQCS